MRHHRVLVVLFILLFRPGESDAGQIDVRTLRAGEKEAFEAGDALMDVLIDAAARDMTCEDCRAGFQRTLNMLMATRASHRSAVVDAESDTTAGVQKKAAMRFEAARTTVNIYTEWQRNAPGAKTGFCGACSPSGGNSGLDALKKEFGDSRGPIVASAFAESHRMLRRAASALQRRHYDPTFGATVDAAFMKWMAKPTNDNVRFAASCIDGILASLLRKSLDPAAYLRDPIKSRDPEILSWGRSLDVVAFVVDGLEEIFITPLFFIQQAKPDVFIHEESHLLYEATDKGAHRLRRGGMKPPRSKGTVTLLDAYSIESLVAELAKL